MTTLPLVTLYTHTYLSDQDIYIYCFRLTLRQVIHRTSLSGKESISSYHIHYGETAVPPGAHRSKGWGSAALPPLDWTRTSGFCDTFLMRVRMYSKNILKHGKVSMSEPSSQPSNHGDTLNEHSNRNNSQLGTIGSTID